MRRKDCTSLALISLKRKMSRLGKAISQFQESLRAIAIRDGPASRFELHRARLAVWRVVDELKVFGKSEEQVLAFVKCLADDTGVQPCEHGVAGCIAPWCIERYYRVRTRFSRRWTG